MTATPKWELRSRYQPNKVASSSSKAGVLTVHEQKVEQLTTLAASLGFVCMPNTFYRQQFLHALVIRLVHRVGKNVYQAPAFSMPLFPRSAALMLLGSANQTCCTATTVTWDFNDLTDLSAFFGSMLSETGKTQAGLTRALQAPSESTAKTLATIIPPVKISSVVCPQKGEVVYINMLYVLSDGNGEVHFPKDDNRLEIAFLPPMVTAIRQKIRADALRLLSQGVPLSSAWLRQLGVENSLILQTVAAEEQHQKAPRLLTEKKAKRKRGHFEIECILKERRTVGKARRWYLVRWAGYDPSWEAWRIHGRVGEQLETWEPATVVKNTEALATWKSSRTPSASPSTTDHL